MKTRQMFSCPHCAGEVLKRNNHWSLDLCLSKARAGKCHAYRNLIVFKIFLKSFIFVTD